MKNKNKKKTKTTPPPKTQQNNNNRGYRNIMDVEFHKPRKRWSLFKRVFAW